MNCVRISTYRSSDKADQVANHTATTRHHDRVARQAVLEHPVLHSRFRLAALALLARRKLVDKDARRRTRRTVALKGAQELVHNAEALQVGVGDQHIGARRKLGQERLHNVRNEVEAELDARIEAPQLMDRRTTHRRVMRRRVVRRHLAAPGVAHGRESEEMWRSAAKACWKTRLR